MEHPLFTISRTTNKNVVQISAVVHPMLSTPVPPYVTAKWIMFEKNANGSVTEELTFFEEKMAFGLRNIVLKEKDGPVDFSVVGFQHMRFSTYNYLPTWKAIAKLPNSGRPAHILNAHINLSPFVKFVKSIEVSALLPCGTSVKETAEVNKTY